jgi:AcrR family transcriptional regulator
MARGDNLQRELDLGLPRERVSDIQRARILTAMFEVVKERGAANASVAHVVGRSGVSRRTFYELFADREDCFLAAFEEAARCCSERVIEACEGQAGSWLSRTRAGLSALLQFLDDEPLMGRLLIVEALGAGPKALERRARSLASVIALVDEGRSQSKPGKEPQSLSAEGVVGAVFAVVHARALTDWSTPMLELTAPLMSMIVLPYLGPVAARKELARSIPARRDGLRGAGSGDPLRGLEMRLTYRTVRVLVAIADCPHASNRKIADAADISDQGQMSKLLARLGHLRLIINSGVGVARGEPNSWILTPTGQRVVQTLRA